MNFFERSIISIKRRKGKSLILFLAILLICNLIAGSISVKKALVKTENNISGGMPIELKAEIDYDKVINKEPEKITEAMVKKIGNSSYLKAYYYSYSYYLTSKTTMSDNGGILYEAREYSSEKIAIDDPFYPSEQGYFSILGTNNNQLKDIINGKIKIMSGAIYTEDDVKSGNNVILISKEVAKKNNLEVGSEITLQKELDDYSTGEYRILKTISEKYKVVGIFEAKVNKTLDDKGNVIYENNPLANYIYMPNNTVKVIHDKVASSASALNIEWYDDLYINSAFYLKNINDIEDFKNENLKLLPDSYKFTDNSELYKTTIGPMKSVETISNYVMYASLGASVLIIGLISLLFLRERKHEMGIYLALGERKMNIALQILIETIAISLLAVCISIFTGNLVAKNISNKMLENQISESYNKNDQYYDEYGYLLNVDKSDIMANYNVKLDAVTIALIFAISIGSITVSTLIPIYYTLKINPKKILM